jgi:hypothetical protein
MKLKLGRRRNRFTDIVWLCPVAGCMSACGHMEGVLEACTFEMLEACTFEMLEVGMFEVVEASTFE